ncbi:M23 family metallopeptidase [Qipengyuania sediminis]|uniref:M23 family metallopeptidase n=1 Tax=Qipengyuania sediminis TaxID=1532023 RepID=UPI001F0D8205|nr:M23 family metallopeptidase [Qipengyuania sediminis]
MIRRSGLALALAMIAGCAAPARAPNDPDTIVRVPPVAPLPPLGADWEIGGAQQQGGWLRGRVPRGAIALAADGREVPLDGTKYFFMGLDRDAPAQVRLTARAADGAMAERTVAIAPREWPIERVNVALRGSVPSESFMARRRPELAAIEAARAVRSESGGWAQTFIWPVKGRISGRFGAQRIYQGVPGAYHSGLDIAPGAGTPYVAPADGVVVLATERPFSLEGNLLIVDHGMGLNSAFLHSATLAVKQGERVRQGQVLGTVAATGRASGPHLHWSLKWQDARLDPLLFLPER